MTLIALVAIDLPLTCCIMPLSKTEYLRGMKSAVYPKNLLHIYNVMNTALGRTLIDSPPPLFFNVH